MLKCPFCNFHNEDGALFCEQCKSDLALATQGSNVLPPIAIPDIVPMAAVIEEAIPMAAIEAAAPAGAPVAVAFAAAPAAPVSVAVAEPPSAPVPVAVASAPSVEEVPPIAPPAVVAEAAPATSVPAAQVSDGAKLPADAKPKLVVLRGQKINAEFPIYEGMNFIGRADEKPVDIDLEDQEPPDRVWCSRQHAMINFEQGVLTVEDLNSANGTYVNRARIYPGQKRALSVNDVIQIGTVQLKVRI